MPQHAKYLEFVSRALKQPGLEKFRLVLFVKYLLHRLSTHSGWIKSKYEIVEATLTILVAPYCFWGYFSPRNSALYFLSNTSFIACPPMQVECWERRERKIQQRCGRYDRWVSSRCWQTAGLLWGGTKYIQLFPVTHKQSRSVWELYAAPARSPHGIVGPNAITKIKKLLQLIHTFCTQYINVCIYVRLQCTHIWHRVAKTHRVPYLYRSFSAKEIYDCWLFCGKWPAIRGILWVFATLYPPPPISPPSTWTHVFFAIVHKYKWGRRHSMYIVLQMCIYY